MIRRHETNARYGNAFNPIHKTSTLIQALHAMGHRARWAHHDCAGCIALSEVNAIDPASSSPDTPKETHDDQA